MEDASIEVAEREDPLDAMKSAAPWLQMVKDADKAFGDYHKRCDNIDKLYASLKNLGEASTERQMQIFWANLEVLKPAIYARPPVPVVVARFKDRDPMLKHAGEILERCLSTSFDMEDINQTMISIRDDLAINGRGVPWLRLDDDDPGAQRVCYDHIERKDFLHDTARKWQEVKWVGKKVYKTRSEMRERFEEASGNEYLNAVYNDKKGETDVKTEEQEACVFEIWHKEKAVVVWVAEGCENVLDIREPFLSLHGFFPCPRPAYGTVERGTLFPVPDFVYYKDQVEEINELTARISALSESLRMKGFYAAGSEDVGQAIETAMKNLDNNAILIPVPNFAALGGAALKDSIIWLPVAEIAAVVTQLIQLRKQLIDDVYQITGISDIMRGSTDSNETLGAQQLKSQYGSIRIRDRQAELTRIARDMTRIAAEIIAENFDADTIKSMSQYKEVPTQADVMSQVQGIQQKIMSAAQNPQIVQQAQQNPQQAQQMMQQAQAEMQRLQSQITFEQVLQFIKSEKTRPFALEIETDSTIQPDEDAQKQRATEFLTAMGGAIAQLAPMVASQPESADFAAEVLKFAVAPFRAGRSLETAIEAFADNMKKSVQQDKPNPEAEKAKAEAAAAQAEMSLKQQQMTIDAQIKEKELGLKTAEGQAKIDLERQKLELERQKVQIEATRTMMDGQRMNQDAQFKERDFQERGADREAARSDKMVSAGMPPDYSFEDDRQQFKTMMDRMEKSDATLAQMVSIVSENQTAIAQALAGLGQMVAAPTELIRDAQGKPVGARKVMQ